MSIVSYLHASSQKPRMPTHIRTIISLLFDKKPRACERIQQQVQRHMLCLFLNHHHFYFKYNATIIITINEMWLFFLFWVRFRFLVNRLMFRRTVKIDGNLLFMILSWCIFYFFLLIYCVLPITFWKMRVNGPYLDEFSFFLSYITYAPISLQFFFFNLLVWSAF